LRCIVYPSRAQISIVCHVYRAQNIYILTLSFTGKKVTHFKVYSGLNTQIRNTQRHPEPNFQNFFT
jgi:hypothetical protein